MAAMLLVWSISPGKVEAWRRFCQEMRGSRQAQYKESRRNLSVAQECVWLAHTPWGAVAIACLEIENPAGALQRLMASTHPFDRWFKRKLLELHGLDLTQVSSEPALELVFEWKSDER